MIRIQFNKDLCLKCKACEFACAVSHKETASDNKAEDVIRVSNICISVRNGRLSADQCKLCKVSKCIESCPNQALYKDENGLVKVIKSKCTGCKKCVQSCPFHAVHFSEYPSMCDRCMDEGEPQCVLACPTKALTYKNI